MAIPPVQKPRIEFIQLVLNIIRRGAFWFLKCLHVFISLGNIYICQTVHRLPKPGKVKFLAGKIAFKVCLAPSGTAKPSHYFIQSFIKFEIQKYYIVISVGT